MISNLFVFLLVSPDCNGLCTGIYAVAKVVIHVVYSTAHWNVVNFYISEFVLY